MQRRSERVTIHSFFGTQLRILINQFPLVMIIFLTFGLVLHHVHSFLSIALSDDSLPSSLSAFLLGTNATPFPIPKLNMFEPLP